MEQVISNRPWILDKTIIVLCLAAFFSVICVTGTNGYKTRSFFHRHHDCVVRLYNGRQVLISTLNNQGFHLQNVTAEFTAFGKHFVLDLSLNRQLFSDTYVENVFHSTEHSNKTTRTLQNSDAHLDLGHCFYHGHLRHQPGSDAAISTCDGLRGYILDQHDSYHIETVKSGVLRVYRGADQRPLPFKCGTEGHDSRLHQHKAILSRHRRSAKTRPPYDSNSRTRYVELYLVSDYRTYERHGRNVNIVIQRSKDIANIVSSLYRKLNIYVVLVGVEVWTGGDLVSVTTSADNTMESFLRYRMQRINPMHPNDNAQLITGVFFNHGVVGKAIKGPICTHQFSGGVNMDYGGAVSLVATTVAHEMGHNFGMEHDNDTQCDCKDDKCIMSATSGKISPQRWSSCSHNALAEAFHLGMDYCLRNIPQTVYGGPVCGNGLKEEGEECDCGLARDCKNRCCNPETCRLVPLASCATGKCCDLITCKPKPATTMCRIQTGECDLPEFCDGKSEFCPNDVFHQNGKECMSGQSYCYHGRCSTHSQQCKLLWGDSGRVSDPICFQQLNMNGNKDGNCAYDWTTNNYIRCNKEDVMCGLLHCVHLNEKLMFWRDNLAIDMRATFLNRGKDQYVCRAALLDVGMDMPNPGLVPDGAKCEHNKICIKQKCTALAKLKIKPCPQNCHGHGICNSEGNCHCHHGYAPPLCDRPGYGGSIDSGPISHDYANEGKLIAILVVFLVIVPLIALCILIFCYRARLRPYWDRFITAFTSRERCKSRKPKPVPAANSRAPTEGGGRGSGGSGAGRGPKPAIHRDNQVSNPLLHHQECETAKSKFGPWKAVKRRDPPPSSAPLVKDNAPPYKPPPPPTRPPSIVKSGSVGRSATNKKVRLSMPIQETQGPLPSDSKASSSTSKGASSALLSNASDDETLGGSKIAKRESFRGSEISGPVLVCTTNRNSLVLADGNVDIIGPEADSGRPTTPAPSANFHVTRSQSASARAGIGEGASQSVPSSGFRSRPVPPLPTEEDDDTQPIYSNEGLGVGDLLSEIQGSLLQSGEDQLYNNLPIQETAPPCPPRPERHRPSAAPQKQSKSNPVAAAQSSQGTLNSNTSAVPGRPGKDSRSSGRGEQGPTHPPAAGSASDRPKTPTSHFSNSFRGASNDGTATESSGSALKNAVSSELRKKILSKSNFSPPTTQASSNGSASDSTSIAPAKPNTPIVISTSSNTKPNSITMTSTNKSGNTNRPASKSKASDDVADSSSKPTPSAPSVSSLKTKFNQSAGGSTSHTPFTQKSTSDASKGGTKTGPAKSTTQSSITKAKGPEKPAGQVKPGPKPLPQKSIDGSKTAAITKNQTQHKASGSKLALDKTAAQAKVAPRPTPGKPVAQAKAGAKPIKSEHSVTSKPTISGPGEGEKPTGLPQRPSLPPKPGEAASSSTSERNVPKAAVKTPGTSAQPKRVQSFRI